MESTPEQAAEGKALVTVLACVLEKLIQANANSGHDRLEAGAVTKFHALRPPGIGVAEYLDRILKYSSCSNECFVLGLIYMDRFIQRNHFALTALNVHRVAITSVMVAAKFFDDQYYNNAYYAKVGGVPCTEINSLEIEFLFGLDFNLAVTGEEFGVYRERLVEHANCSACGCSTGILKRQRAINPATSTSSPMLSDLGRDGRASASPGPVAQGYASGWLKSRDGSDDLRAPDGDHRQNGHLHGDVGPELITPAAVLGSNHQPSIQRATNKRISGGGIVQGNGGVSGMCAPVGAGRGEVGAGGGGGSGVGGVGVAHQGVFDPEAAAGLERQLQQQLHQAQDHQQQLQMQQQQLQMQRQHQAQDHQQQLQLQMQQQQQQQQTKGKVGYRRLHQHQKQQQQQQPQVMLDREALGAEALLSMGVNDSLFEDARGHHQVQRPVHQSRQSAPQQQFFGQQEQQQQQQQQQQHHHRHQAGGAFTTLRPGGAAAAATTVDGSSGRMAMQDVSVSVSTTAGGSIGGRAPGHKHALNTGGGGGGPVASQRFRITPSPERALPLPTSSSGVGLNMAAFAGGSEGSSSGSGSGMEVTSSSAFGSIMTTTVCGGNGGSGNGGFGGYGGGGLPLPPGHARRGSTGGAVRGMGSGDLAAAVMTVSAASMAPAGGAMEGGFSALGSGLGGLCKGEVMGLRGGSDGGAMVAPHAMGGGLGAGMYDGGGIGAGMDNAGAGGGESTGGGILFGKQQLQLRRQQHRIRPTQQQHQQQQQPRPHRLHAAVPPPPHPNHQHHPPHQHHHHQSHQHHLGLSVAAMQQVQAAFAAGRPTASSSHAGPPERGPFSAGGVGACGGNGINGGGGGGAGFTVSPPRYRDVAGASVSGNGDLMIGDTLVNGNYFADVGGGMGGGGLASGNGSGLHAAAGSYYDHNRHHVSAGAGAGAGAGANAFGLGANSIVGNGVGPLQAAQHHAGRGHRPRNASASCGNFPLPMVGGDGGDGGVGILVGGGPGGFPLDLEAVAEARKRQDDGMSVSTPPSGTAGLDGGGGYFESVPPPGLGGGSVVGTGGGGRAGGIGGDLYSSEGDEVFYTPQRVRADAGYGFPHNRGAGFGGGGGGGVGSDGSVYLTPRSTTSHMEGEVGAGDGRTYAHQCLDPSISYTAPQDLSQELEGFDVGLDRRQPARTGLSGAAATGGPQGTGVGWPLDTGR